MQHPVLSSRTFVTMLACACAVTHDAWAQPAAAPFPAGKPVSIHVAAPPGGGNDNVMRLVARNIGKYLPGNPNVVARNTPGAGGRRLGGMLYNTAPRDGTELAFLHRGMVTEQILGDTALPYRLQDMTWIGTPTTVTDTCIVWHTAQVQSLQDLKHHELVIAGTGNEASQIALLQRLVGGRIRSVIGYPGGPPSNMAMERGEVGGRCSYSWEAISTAIPDWVRDKKIKPIVQFALTRHPELPDVPLITDFARNDLDRRALRVLLTPQIFGFPFAAPPALRPEVREIWRTAFDRTMQDQQVIEEAKKIKLTLAPVSGAELERAAHEAFSAAPEAIAHAKALVAPH